MHVNAAAAAAAAAEYPEHVYLHSSMSDAPGLHPPGCPLRGYGCSACRITNLIPIASSSSRNQYELSAVDGAVSGSDEFNGKGRGGKDVREECGKGEGRPKNNGGGGVGKAGLRVHGIESCVYYTLVCPSCKQEVRR